MNGILIRVEFGRYRDCVDICDSGGIVEYSITRWLIDNRPLHENKIIRIPTRVHCEVLSLITEMELNSLQNTQEKINWMIKRGNRVGIAIKYLYSTWDHLLLIENADESCWPVLAYPMV